MLTNVGNRYIVALALATVPLVVTRPNGGRDYRVPKGSIFVASLNVAHAAARAGLCRAVDIGDVNAPSECDAAYFARYGSRHFELSFDEGQSTLAVKIERYVEPTPAVRIDAFPQAPAPAPLPATGFETPRFEIPIL